MLLIILCKRNFEIQEGLELLGFIKDSSFINFWLNDDLVSKNAYPIIKDNDGKITIQDVYSLINDNTIRDRLDIIELSFLNSFNNVLIEDYFGTYRDETGLELQFWRVEYKYETGNYYLWMKENIKSLKGEMLGRGVGKSEEEHGVVGWYEDMYGARSKVFFWKLFWETFINVMLGDIKSQVELLYRLGFIPLEIHFPDYLLGVDKE
ncbi:MAG: hypothetical protein ACTSR2_13030 [Candidatus Hodarchaeales archaeon]